VLNSTTLFKHRREVDTHPATPTEKKRIREILTLHRADPDHLEVSKNSLVTDLRSIDPALVGLLNDLLNRTGAKVVVSSTWRKTYTVASLQRLLGYFGFSGEVIGRTPWGLPRIHSGPYATSSPLRGHEIQHWIDSQPEPPSSFAILDDDTDMAHLRDRLVRTDIAVGLTRENVEEAVRLFEG